MRNVKDKNPPYSDYQQQFKDIVVILSVQKKSEDYVAICKKIQSRVRCENGNDYGNGQGQFVSNVWQKLSKDCPM